MSTYQPKIQTVPYGLHIPYNQGYDAKSRAKAPTAEKKGASGYLQRDSDKTTIALWVTDVSADFSVSGETGQSQILREFFPRSFNDVTVTITGNVASTYEYNRLAAFVREAHWNALNAVRTNSVTVPTITFNLADNTPEGWGKSKTVKGKHRPWQISGYIGSMNAGAVAHEVAPQFSIGLIVTDSVLNATVGLWSETTAQTPVLKDILSMIDGEKYSHIAKGTKVDVTTSQGLGSAATQRAIQKGVEAAGETVQQTVQAALNIFSGF